MLFNLGAYLGLELLVHHRDSAVILKDVQDEATVSSRQIFARVGQDKLQQAAGHLLVIWGVNIILTLCSRPIKWLGFIRWCIATAWIDVGRQSGVYSGVSTPLMCKKCSEMCYLDFGRGRAVASRSLFRSSSPAPGNDKLPNLSIPSQLSGRMLLKAI